MENNKNGKKAREEKLEIRPDAPGKVYGCLISPAGCQLFPDANVFLMPTFS